MGVVEYVWCILGYVGSALESIAFVTNLVNIRCTLGCFGSTLRYVGSTLEYIESTLRYSESTWEYLGITCTTYKKVLVYQKLLLGKGNFMEWTDIHMARQT